jgi:hypothetical protein
MSANDKPQTQTAGTMNSRRPAERRTGKKIPVALERRGIDRSKLPERRRQVDPTTCERDYNDEEIVFMKSMDNYKRDNRRPFPTWSEVLEVLFALGYRKVAEATTLPGNTRPIDLPPKG